MPNDRKTLCIIANQFIVGGIERVVLDALPYLSDNYDVTLLVVTDYFDNTFLDKARAYARVVLCGKHYSKAQFIASQLPHTGGMMLRRMIKEHYDVLIVTSPYSLPASFSRIADKMIYWYHGNKDIMYENSKTLSFAKHVNKFRLKSLYRRYDQVWTLNERINDGLNKAFGLKNTRILPNPIDCEIIAEKANCPSEFYHNCGINMVVVGRLSHEKGVMRVLLALKNLEPQEKDVHLHIVGDGPEREALEHAANDTKNVFVHFYGRKENPYPYISSSDILICPSYHESFGIVMLEAMTLKVPIITTDTVGGRYITENGKYGILTENSDEALAEKLFEYIIDPRIVEEFTAAAYEHARKFDIVEFNKLIESYLST